MTTNNPQSQQNYETIEEILRHIQDLRIKARDVTDHELSKKIKLELKRLHDKVKGYGFFSETLFDGL